MVHVPCGTRNDKKFIVKPLRKVIQVYTVNMHGELRIDKPIFQGYPVTPELTTWIHSKIKEKVRPD